uniref:hypothetical protein n=1 Tax=Hyphomonas atlantica TaxID=1280948 RepID=UPI0032B11D55
QRPIESSGTLKGEFLFFSGVAYQLSSQNIRNIDSDELTIKNKCSIIKTTVITARFEPMGDAELLPVLQEPKCRDSRLKSDT